MVDTPNRRKIHSDTMPRVGGLALMAGSFLSILIWVPFDRQITALSIGVGILLFSGAWDDRSDLNYKVKFLAQFLAAGIVVWYGRIIIHQLPLLDDFQLPTVYAMPLTILVIVAITNAINFADGLDGLSGGKTLLILVFLAVLGYRVDAVGLTAVNVILVGAILGFLRYNTHPARVFMGDAGSQTLGFCAASLAIILTQHSDVTLSPALPLILFCLPIYDTASVIIQRLYQGRSPFSPDQNHLHHKLLNMGFQHYEAVLLVYIVQAILVISAYYLRYESDALLLIIFFVICGIITLLLGWANYSNWQFGRNGKQTRPHRNPINRFFRSPIMTQTTSIVASLLIPVIILMGALIPSKIPVDFGLAASAMLLFVIIIHFIRPNLSFFYNRGLTYVASAFSIYLLEATPSRLPEIGLSVDVVFIILAIAIVLHIFSNARKEFSLTTMDFLVIFLCVIVPGVAALSHIELPIGDASIKLAVLMYACEVVLISESRQTPLVIRGTLGAIGVLALRCLG